jgi:hypothetical protein
MYCHRETLSTHSVLGQGVHGVPRVTLLVTLCTVLEQRQVDRATQVAFPALDHEPLVLSPPSWLGLCHDHKRFLGEQHGQDG